MVEITAEPDVLFIEKPSSAASVATPTPVPAASPGPASTPNVVIMEPARSLKHEAALADLKQFITSVLQTKLETIRSSVSQKIVGHDETKKGDDSEKKRNGQAKGKKA